MRYFSCIWIHSDVDYPILYAVEVGDDGYESRKFELRRNGMMGWSDKDHEVNGVYRGEMAVPPVDEINLQKDFRAWEIDKAAFERFWSMRESNK